jgi:hypothetical protein
MKQKKAKQPRRNCFRAPEVFWSYQRVEAGTDFGGTENRRGTPMAVRLRKRHDIPAEVELVVDIGSRDAGEEYSAIFSRKLPANCIPALIATLTIVYEQAVRDGVLS